MTEKQRRGPAQQPPAEPPADQAAIASQSDAEPTEQAATAVPGEPGPQLAALPEPAAQQYTAGPGRCVVVLGDRVTIDGRSYRLVDAVRLGLVQKLA